MNMSQEYQKVVQLLNSGDTRMAKKHLEALMVYADDFPLFYAAMATAFYDEKNYDAAISWYEKTQQKLPGIPDVLFNLAKSYRKKGNLLKATEIFKECLPVSNRMIREEVLIDLYRIYCELDDDNNTKYYLQEIVLTYPRLIWIHEYISKYMSKNIPEHSPLLSKIATEILGAIGSKDSNSNIGMSDVRNLISQPSYLILMAYLHSDRKEYRKAIHFLLRAHELSPDSDYILGELGYHYMALDQIDNALKVYRQLDNKYPDNLTICYNLGNALFELDKFDEAEQYLRKATPIAEGKSAYHYMIAHIYHCKGNLQSAREHYLRAISLDPLYKAPHRNLFYLSGQQKDKEALLEYAIELNKHGWLEESEFDFAIDFFGKLKDANTAASFIEKNIHIFKGNTTKLAKVYHLWGGAYEHLKDYEKARWAYEKSLDLDPTGNIHLAIGLHGMYAILNIKDKKSMHPAFKGVFTFQYQDPILDEFKIMPYRASHKTVIRDDLSDISLCAFLMELENGRAKEKYSVQELNDIAFQYLSRNPSFSVSVLEFAKKNFPDYIDTYNNLGYILPKTLFEVKEETGDKRVIAKGPDPLSFTFKGKMIDIEECNFRDALLNLKRVLDNKPDHLSATINLLSLSYFIHKTFHSLFESGFWFFADIDDFIKTPEILWRRMIDIIEHKGLFKRIGYSRNEVYVAEDSDTNLATRIIFKRSIDRNLDHEYEAISFFSKHEVNCPHVFCQLKEHKGKNYLIIENEGTSLFEVFLDLKAKHENSFWLIKDSDVNKSAIHYLRSALQQLAKITVTGVNFINTNRTILHSTESVFCFYEYDKRFFNRFIDKLPLYVRQKAWQSECPAVLSQVINYISSVLASEPRLYYKDANPKNWIVLKSQENIIIKPIDFETHLLAAPQIDLVNLLEYEGTDIEPTNKNVLLREYYQDLLEKDVYKGRELKSYDLFYNVYLISAILRHCEIAGYRVEEYAATKNLTCVYNIYYHLSRASECCDELLSNDFKTFMKITGGIEINNCLESNLHTTATLLAQLAEYIQLPQLRQ